MLGSDAQSYSCSHGNKVERLDSERVTLAQTLLYTLRLRRVVPILEKQVKRVISGESAGNQRV